MSRWLKKAAILWIAIGLIVSSLQTGASAVAAAAANVPDGVYAVDYTILHDEHASTSVANDYMKTNGEKGSLIIENGTVKFEHKLTAVNYTRFPYLGYRLAGKAKAGINNEVVSGIEGYQAVSTRPVPGENGSYIVQYVIADLTQKQDVLMHIFIPEYSYDHWYNVRLSIDTSTLPGIPGGGNGGVEPEEPTVTKVTYSQLDEFITVSRSVYYSSSEGTAYGDYPIGSKAALWSVIDYADTVLGLTPTGDLEAYGNIYNTLKGALKLFESRRKQADRTELESFIKIITEFTNNIAVNGAAEGSPGSASAAIASGEYYHSDINTLVKNLGKAKTAVNTPSSTPQQLSNSLATLANNYKRAKDSQYLAAKPVKIYALDTLEPTNTQSVYANEISNTVTTIVSSINAQSLSGFLANVALKGPPANAKVAQSWPNADGTFQIIKSEAYTHYANRSSALSNADGQVYQLSPRGTDSSDEDWQGLSYISYDINGVTRDVYLSFNVEKLERLQSSLAQYKRLHDTATKADSADQAALAAAKGALLAAIKKAKLTADNLSATRPAITSAQAELDLAADAFKALIVYERYFSTLHGTNAAFSSADSYFLKPATIGTEANGDVSVTFTVKDNAAIKEIKVERDGSYKDVEIASVNEAANTRVVTFKTADLSVLHKAKVRVVVSQGGQIYDQTHDIRLNFNDVNNTALAQAISAASVVQRAAVVGTAIGQYPAEAKNALQAAITAAGAAAAGAENTQAQTDEALLALNQAIAAFKDKAIKGIADGDYKVNFRILKFGTNEDSVMQTYVNPVASLKVRGADKTMFITLKQHKEITALKFKGQDVKVESIDEATNTRVVSLPLTDLTTVTDGWVKVDWPAINYHHEYDIQLKLDASSLTGIFDASALNALIKTAQETHDAAVEGTKAGNFKAGSKALLAAAITDAQAAGQAPQSQAIIDAAAAKLKQALDTFQAAKIGVDPIPNPNPGSSDGQYSIAVRILKFGTDQDSVMQDYIIPAARLKVAGSSKLVYLTIKQDKEITGLKFNGANVSTESSNKEKNTRVVYFPVSDLSKVTDGWVKIDWPEMSYHHEYNIQIKFDESSMKPISGQGDIELEEEKDKDEGKGKEELVEPVVTGFKDIEGHWAQASVEKAIALGIAKGYEDGKFRPNGVITRGEFAVMISRALKLKSSAADAKFNDNSQIPNWAQEHIFRAVGAGLIGGYEDQTFRASNEITRSELAVIIARAAKLKISEDAVLSFDDADQFPAWAKKEAAAAIQAGLIQGKGNNKFDPNASATRAEALTLILRVLENL
ncbi:NEAT domain-containing protein [Paenibacillus sp. FJAT-27812]|uniref:NEAT domain-containing protein n=1 Tax=Paenibacillus sp. FJAT-27812 TaxID=1684143 RepID=UPI0006A7B152|nr:NEAT domain-containing protein [Paenibacillus sp. FJAT-27812]